LQQIVSLHVTLSCEIDSFTNDQANFLWETFVHSGDPMGFLLLLFFFQFLKVLKNINTVLFLSCFINY